MCTLSWWQHEHSYGVLFNRDESRQRSAAQPPRLRERHDISYLSPLDPDGGGTWIWVNQAGIIGCILNNYAAPGPNHEPVSRGLLLDSLARHTSLAALEEAVKEIDCGAYRGFHLFGCDSMELVMYSWDGSHLGRKDGDELSCPVTTSGYRPEEVVGFRQELFGRQVGPDSPGYPEKLEQFHRYHDEEFPAHSPLMVRSDARTVSLSRVWVEEELITFSYRAVAENRQLQPSTTTVLGRDL